MKKLIVTVMTVLVLSPVAFAESKGGGGGDASEARVNEIRADILRWIQDGGSRSLELPKTLTHDSYVRGMTSILSPQKVVIGFLANDHQTDLEKQVSVDGVPKTCRGFYAKSAPNTPYIICNIARFAATSESEQYRLIHHEFAGLVKIERNVGAASDYAISSQLTDYLGAERVLKLQIKRARPTKSMFDQLLAKHSKSSFPRIEDLKSHLLTGRCYFKDDGDRPYGAALTAVAQRFNNGPLSNPTYQYWANKIVVTKLVTGREFCYHLQC